MHDADRIRRELSRLYDKDPQGWSLMLGKDPSGFYDMLFSHGKDTWLIKEHQVNPYKFVGFGAKMPGVAPPEIPRPDYPFGLRPVSLANMKEMASLLEDPKGLNELASRILNQRPVTVREALEGPAILHGPIMQSNSPIHSISSAHSRLDDKLRSELRRFVYRKYGHTLTPYI